MSDAKKIHVKNRGRGRSLRQGASIQSQAIMANSNEVRARGRARPCEQAGLRPAGTVSSNVQPSESALRVGSVGEHSLQSQAIMANSNEVRARGRARPCEQAGLRPVGTLSSNDQPSESALRVRSIGEHSLQSQIDRTANSQQVGLCNTTKKTNEEGIVSDSYNKGQFSYDETLSSRPASLSSKKGTSGTPINLQANYFQLTTNTHWRLYQYRVDFVPDEDRTQVRKKILAQVYKDKLPGYIFDGSTLFTSTQIPSGLLTITTNSKDVTDATRAFKISLRLVGDVEHGDYHLLQVFNIIIRKCLGLLKLQVVGRNYYDALAAINIPKCGIELWPGYITSIRQHESKILMCCEITHKCMRKENVLHILNRCLSQDAVHYKRIFEKLIVGCVVLADYNNRNYRIDDIDWDKTIQSTFSQRDGTSVSYKEYYRQRYQLNISLDCQPLLVSRAKPRELRAGMSELKYLVPELCRMTGLTGNNLPNAEIKRTLAEHTRLAPDERIRRLKLYRNRMHNVPEVMGVLNKWDITLDPKLLELTGRILPSETIIQGKMGKVRYTAGRDCNWTRKFSSNTMIVPGIVNTWVVMYPMQLKREVVQFVQNLRKVACNMALNLPQPTVQEITDDRPATYIAGLEYAIGKFNPNLILCVASNYKADRYNAIKKKCCVDRGVPSQVILRKNIVSKAALSVAMKVAIQINCKLGGAPWTVEIPISNLMVVGFDVSHDIYDKRKSYGAMVSSLDNQMTRYFSIVSAHTNGEELSNDISLNIIKSIIKYQEVNQGRIPDRIIIYRDGVGDGQLTYVHRHEVEGIRQALYKYNKGKEIKFAFIVVTKRINTRIFAQHHNPPPGTVVDDVITLPQRYDFFIVSQNVRQGTVSPTNYNVIHDTLGLLPDHIQRITYKFTHTYYNWTGTIRVPAPCQYAHKLAYLVCQSLHRDPHPRLNNTLFFL